MSDYDPSNDPPGRGRIIAVSVVIGAFAIMLLAAWLSGAI